MINLYKVGDEVEIDDGAARILEIQPCKGSALSIKNDFFEYKVVIVHIGAVIWISADDIIQGEQNA